MSNGTDPYKEVLGPSRQQAIQKADTTIPTPPQPSEVDPYEKVLQDTAYDPYESVLNPTPESMSRRLSFLQGQREETAATPGKPPSFLERHRAIGIPVEIARVVGEQIVNAVHDSANALVWSLSGTLPGEPQETPTYGDVATQLAAQRGQPTPPLSPEHQASVERGTAFIASYAAAEAVGGLGLAPKLTGLLGGSKTAALVGKWAGFTVAEGLGGAVFGAIRPKEEDESRLNAILGDASVFAAAGVGMKATFEFIPGAYKRYILAMPRAKRIAALQRVARGLDGADESLAHGSTSLDQLPAEHRAAIEVPVLESAIRSVDEDFPRFVAKVISDHLSAEPRPTLDDEFTAALQEVRESRAATRARRAETARARRAAKKAKPPEEPPPEPPAGGGEELITGAAVKTEDGSVFKGTTHADAYEDAGAAGAEFGAEEGHGFSTNQREFVSNEEARRLNLRADPASVRAQVAVHPPEMTAEEAFRPVELIAPPSKMSPQGFSAVISRNTTPGEGLWKLSEFEGPKPSPEDAGAYQHFATKEDALNAAAELGYRPMPEGEFVTGPTVRGHSGKLYVNGETHGAVMESARAVGVPKGEFQGIGANHPNRGFRTNLRDFIDRETAGQMVGFPGRLFSEDLHALKATPLESTIAADTQIKDIAKQVVEASTDPEAKDIAETALMDVATDRAVAAIKPLDVSSKEIQDAAASLGAATTRAMRHGAEVNNAVSIINEGLRPGSSISLAGGRDFEGYPVVLTFAGRGDLTPYSSPFGPTMHEGAATTAARQAKITAVHMDVDDFTSREDAIEAYNRVREALDETGRKDIPIEAARFNEATDKYEFGGKVDFSTVRPYGETIARMSDDRLNRESGEVLDNWDAADRFGNTAVVEKYQRRLDMIADEMEKRGLLGDAVVEKTVSDALDKFGESGQAEDEITQHLTHPLPGELAEEAKLTPHDQLRTEVKETPKEPKPCL